MKIIAFGDSWVFGDEIADDDAKKRESVNLTGIIRNTYKLSTYNFAINGGSLDEIILQIISYLNSPHYNTDDLILIGLTSPIRKYHYNNILKTGIRFPSWSWDSFSHWGNPKLTTDVEYKKWWELNIKYNVNVRNDVIEYFKSILTIKSLLSDFNKYIIWQSIDGDFYEQIETDYENLTITYYDNIGRQYAYSDLFFDKKYTDFLLKKNTLETQLWLNLSESSWRKWLYDNGGDLDVFFKDNHHPNLTGINLWFDNFLKKYIDKVLDI